MRPDNRTSKLSQEHRIITVVKQFDDVDGRNHQHTSKYHIHVIYGRRILTSVGDGLDFELNRQQVSLTTRCNIVHPICDLHLPLRIS